VHCGFDSASQSIPQSSPHLSPTCLWLFVEEIEKLLDSFNSVKCAAPGKALHSPLSDNSPHIGHWTRASNSVKCAAPGKYGDKKLDLPFWHDLRKFGCDRSKMKGHFSSKTKNFISFICASIQEFFLKIHT
jgi:hypothetical protein